MCLRGLNRRGAQVGGFEPGAAESRGYTSFFAISTIVISVLPDTAATGRLLDAAALAQLPRHAFLINVGRSNVLDMVALTTALEKGSLGGALLDVFDTEPLPPDDPLWRVPNLQITPHVAAHSDASQMAALFVKNYRHFADSEPLEFVVDLGSGY